MPTPMPHWNRWPTAGLGMLDPHETPLLTMLPRRRRLRIYRSGQRAPRAVRGFHAFGYRPRTRKVEWSDKRLAP
jgi:hypothetical protein